MKAGVFVGWREEWNRPTRVQTASLALIKGENASLGKENGTSGVEGKE